MITVYANGSDHDMQFLTLYSIILIESVFVLDKGPASGVYSLLTDQTNWWGKAKCLFWWVVWIHLGDITPSEELGLL